ncbi:tRNA-dihydrouridine(20) synthase [NAD(P)+]-like, partial [Nowakowskiella sp. JEL0078]
MNNKLVLAPMVRVGTLPMRLMALRYGADIVYSPEIVDKRLITCIRGAVVVNLTCKCCLDDLGTIDFISQVDNSLCLRIHSLEKSSLIVQIGTADPELAVRAAKVVAGDVAGIDVNCGCPKRFSLQGGMGAALLSDPKKLCRIVNNLIENINVPISVKVRILNTTKETIELLKEVANTGVKAIAVHCRTKYETPTDSGHWDYFPPIVEAIPAIIPIIANGDIFSPPDFPELLRDSGISSFMLARGAQWNPSIFLAARGYLNAAYPERYPAEIQISKQISEYFNLPNVTPYIPLNDDQTNGMLPIKQMMQEYVKIARATDFPYQNSKYTLMQMFPPCGFNHKKLKRDETVTEEKPFPNFCQPSDDRASEIENMEKSICNSKANHISKMLRKRKGNSKPDYSGVLDKEK